MNTEKNLALISDLFGLASRYSIDDFDNARRYVDRSFQGDDQKRLLAILSKLRSLRANRIQPPSEDATEAMLVADTAPENHELRELRAILLDEQFLRSKISLLNIIRKVLHLKPSSRLEKKASRTEVAAWAINVIAKQPPAIQRSVYNSVRQLYLRQRESSLGGWADIILGDAK
jgi:hypothetical protein